MSEFNRNKVLSYISSRDYSPLVFIRGDWIYSGGTTKKNRIRGKFYTIRRD